MRRSSRLHVIVPVWGRDYIHRFMSNAVPAHLTGGNLLALIGEDARLCFYTREEDRHCFEEFPSYHQVARALAVEVVAVPEIDYSNKLYALTEIYAFAIRRANREGAAMIFFQPDTAFPDGTFSWIMDLWRSGWRAVVAHSFCSDRQRFWELYRTRNGVDGREFTRLLLASEHEETSRFLWDEECVLDPVDSLYWRVDDVGYVVRSFRLMPVFVDPDDKSATIHWTPDVDYLQRACRDVSSVYVVRDSDELLIASLMERGEVRKKRPICARPAAEVVAMWANFATHEMHIDYFSRPIFVHGEDLDERWAEAVDASGMVVERVLEAKGRIYNGFLDVLSRAGGRRISIFGAGDLGLLVSRGLVMYGALAHAHYDNDRNKRGRVYGGVPVLEPPGSPAANEFIVVASMWWEEIREQLIRSGFVEGGDFLVLKSGDIYL
ncbi:hypothetical protein [Endothiovibrio diazotrophicus]